MEKIVDVFFSFIYGWILGVENFKFVGVFFYHNKDRHENWAETFGHHKCAPEVSRGLRGAANLAEHLSTLGQRCEENTACSASLSWKRRLWVFVMPDKKADGMTGAHCHAVSAVCNADTPAGPYKSNSAYHACRKTGSRFGQSLCCWLLSDTAPRYVQWKPDTGKEVE